MEYYITFLHYHIMRSVDERREKEKKDNDGDHEERKEEKEEKEERKRVGAVVQKFWYVMQGRVIK